MRLFRHIGYVVWIGLWARLAKFGIGDPLNQLVYVAPFRSVAPSYRYKPRRMRSYRRNKRLEGAVAREFASPESQPHKGVKEKDE